MSAQRDRKLAEVAEIAAGVLGGIAAHDDRLEEMGPGINARSTDGGASKGAVSKPTERAVERPAVVVTSHLSRLIDRLHAVALDVDAAYGEIARTRNGLAVKGEPS